MITIKFIFRGADLFQDWNSQGTVPQQGDYVRINDKEYRVNERTWINAYYVQINLEKSWR